MQEALAVVYGRGGNSSIGFGIAARMALSCCECVHCSGKEAGLVALGASAAGERGGHMLRCAAPLHAASHRLRYAVIKLF